MAERDIIQNMIFQLGQSQESRMPKELGTHFSDVDERTPKELMRFTKKFAAFVNYYRESIATPIGNWSNFFPNDEAALQELIGNKSADVTPHLALFLAFLKLYEKPQEVINRITGRHLDFYYKDILRLTKKSAVPDKAHLLLELKKKAVPLSILPESLFSAGKDATGVELLYAPVRETIINISKVSSLRSLFLDNSGHGTIHNAPIANSSDGVGGALTGDEKKWYVFGHEDLPEAEVGFAIASPVLRMKEGLRKVTVSLTLGDSGELSDDLLENAFEVFITGEKGWLGPYLVAPMLNDDNLLTFDFTVLESEKAVIDYSAAIHGYSYVVQAPILQVLLKSSEGVGYNDFSGVTLQKAQISVTVSNIISLSLESDGGTLDPKKAFLPFGPQPTIGSRFTIGYDEALSKKLSEVEITLQWKAAPEIFATHYANYGTTVSNDDFTAAVSIDGECGTLTSGSSVALFESDESDPHIMTFSITPATRSITDGIEVYALNTAGSLWATNLANQMVLANPVLTPFLTTVPEPPTGSITLTLEKDFLHSVYRKKYVENVMTFSKQTSTTPALIMLNEPYTPTIQTISLSYTAQSNDVDITSNSLEDFANEDIQFFQIAYFGQMREHQYQREQFTFLTDKTVSLLPTYNNEGELLIGLSDLNAGDSVNLLFQVAEGSADPDFSQEDIIWSVLCDNYWKPLDSSGVLFDTTNQLLTSGTIQFVIPAEATPANTILPAGYIWIKGAVTQNVTALCQLIEVSANAVEVQFTDNDNDSNHLITALEAGKITKLKNGLSAVKSVKQPVASFGGSPVELDDPFTTRVSERLRHKNRCITAWDYERIILEAFPQVHTVKAIPHAKEGNYLAPGNVLIVVIPNLKNKNAVDPLQPKVSADTLSQITSFVEERTGQQVKVMVKNPNYQKIQADFKVSLHEGYEFNYYSNAINQALIEFLSPWAYNAERDITFGGKLYKSVLLDFVEELGYVDYVTDFAMYSYAEENNDYTDINETEPETPDAIMVSAEAHIIGEVI